jgi:hypothetical protein
MQGTLNQAPWVRCASACSTERIRGTTWTKVETRSLQCCAGVGRVVPNPSIVSVAGKRWCGSQAGGCLVAALFRRFRCGRVRTFRLPAVASSRPTRQSDATCLFTIAIGFTHRLTTCRLRRIRNCPHENPVSTESGEDSGFQPPISTALGVREEYAL